MKLPYILIAAVFLVNISGCASTRFKPFHEVAEVCHDPIKRTGCLKTLDGVDNTTLFKHDHRELSNIEVPR